MRGKDILSIAKGLLGNPYRLGAYVPKNKAGYKGDFDCQNLYAIVFIKLTVSSSERSLTTLAGSFPMMATRDIWTGMLISWVK